MAWEYEGLFDAIPSQEEDLLSSFWRVEDTDIRVGNMGYRTETTKAGTRLEARIYPIFGRAMEKKAKRAAKILGNTPDAMKDLNISNAKRKLILLLEANFEVFKDDMITLTYTKEPDSLERCKKDVRNFLLRVKRYREKNEMPELKYLLGIGHDADQKLHAHIVLSGGIDIKEYVKLWKRGIVNGYMLQEFGNGMEGAANYLYKQNEMEKRRGNRINYHMWSGSRNLKKPKEHKSDSKVSNRKVKLLARNFDGDAKQIMEKIYPGYTLEKHVVIFSDSVDGVYIKCVMRKKEELTPWMKLFSTRNSDSFSMDNSGKPAKSPRRSLSAGAYSC